MKTLLFIVSASFGLGILLTPVVRRLALAGGLVDHPDGRRKLHRLPTPLGGGVAIFLAATISLLIALPGPGPLRDQLAQESGSLIGLMIAAIIICLVGLADDYYTLRGRHKLLGQLLAVGTVMSSGVVVQNIHLFGIRIELGILALPFTALWLLGAINSLNLIDGIDGLLGAVGTILCVAMALLAIVSGQWVAAAVACALAGALLAFLCFNLPPASIFMGDCGSMLVGLVIGTIAIQGSLKGPATVALAAPTALLTIPIFDTLAAILRRTLTGRSIYTTDRGHIHHCLLRQGLSNRRILVFVSTLCLLTMMGSLASLALNNELFAAAGALLVLNILVVSRRFGYAESLLLKERLAGMAARILDRGHRPQPRQMEVRLQGSADWAELWSGLIASAGPLDLETICLDVNAPAVYEGYHARWHCGSRGEESQPTWRLEVPLLVNGQKIGRLEVAWCRGADRSAEKMLAVAQWTDELKQDIAALVLSHEPAKEPDPEAVPPPPAPTFLIDRAVSDPAEAIR